MIQQILSAVKSRDFNMIVAEMAITLLTPAKGANSCNLAKVDNSAMIKSMLALAVTGRRK